MEKKKEWEKFFDNHAPKYMGESFTRNTEAEIEFVINELGLKKGSRILDIGCGTGRHSVGLAKRGYRMTGIDLSSGMLAQAAEAASRAGVEIELIHADAAKYDADKKFDAAICLCEGAFALLGMDDDPLERDLAILKNTGRALNPGAGLIMTVPNGMEKIRKYSMDDVISGDFDPATIVEKCVFELSGEDTSGTVQVREKGYIATELTLLLRLAGFETKHVWGGTAGNWGRRKIDLDEIEIMVIARKI